MCVLLRMHAWRSFVACEILEQWNVHRNTFSANQCVSNRSACSFNQSMPDDSSPSPGTDIATLDLSLHHRDEPRLHMRARVHRNDILACAKIGTVEFNGIPAGGLYVVHER
jgi:hypothetical protein